MMKGDFPLMKYNRIHEIEDYLQRVISATNTELMEHFEVSMQTLRRDLKELEDKGVLQKVYGGVVYVEDEMKQNSILDINLREITNVENKRIIGQLASNCVEENDIIFVDSGTTAFHMIPYLSHLQHVTIISHSLHVMSAIRDRSNITAICLGGVYQPQTGTFFSDMSAHPYNYNKAFLSTVGISINKGLTNTDVQEGVMKRMIMRNANEVFVLADESKFNNVAFHQFADINDVDVIVTNKALDEKFMNFLKKHEIKVIIK